MKKLWIAAAVAIALLLNATAAIADVPISGLPAATYLGCNDFIPIVQSGTTYRITGCMAWTPAGPVVFTGAGTYGTASQVYIAEDGGATPGIVINVPTSSTNGIQFQTNQVTKASISAAGVGTFTGLNDSALGASLSVCTDGSKNLTTTCSGGGVSSVTAGASANLTASPTTGAVVVDLVSNPTLSGLLTLSGTAPQLSFSGTGGTQINSAQAAANSFTINTTTTSTNTTAMFQVKNNGTMEFEVGSGGAIQAAAGLTLAGALSGVTTIGNSGVQTNSNATTSALTLSGSGAGINFSGLTVATFTSGAGATAGNWIFTGTTTQTSSPLLTLKNNGTNQLTAGAGGGLKIAPTINATQVLGDVAPCYAVGGTACGSTMHTVIGTCAFSASTSCTPTAFSVNSVFASATSYACRASGGAGTFAQTGALSIGSQSTTGIIITAATSNSQTVAFECTGT